jgi:recombinational DNA repair protein (RecF pathway)
MSRKKPTGIAQSAEGQIQSWIALVSAGYLKNLSSCPRCQSDLGQAFVYYQGKPCGEAMQRVDLQIPLQYDARCLLARIYCSVSTVSTKVAYSFVDVLR